MTRYTRSVIPGRKGGEGGRDLDRAVFGERNARGAANDMDVDDYDAMPADEADEFVARANTDRRKTRRRKADKSDYKPLPDARMGYRPPNEGGMRGPLLLAGALIVVGVFGYVVFNAYRDGVRAEDGETPTLAAAGPFKSKPVEVASAREPREDASVFERVESAPKSAPVEDVRPTPDVRIEKAVEPPAPAKVEPAKPEPVKSAPVVAQPTIAQQMAAPPKAATPTAAPAPKPAAPVVTAAPAPVAVAGGFTPAFAKGGNYLVQIGAAATEAGADTEWNRRSKISPALFGGAEKVVVRADVNGKTVYRVRAGSFATPADADAFCSAFKATGGDCFRTAR